MGVQEEAAAAAAQAAMMAAHWEEPLEARPAAPAVVVMPEVPAEARP
jgi:hypothetical protein